MPQRTAGKEVTALLEEWGVKHIYGMPGDSINELIEELRHESSKIQFIQTRHEEVAALSAAAD
ncbi:pyruvate oxidase, partial [Bacillus altitudinis]|nr:pyruvate oxidase [Bacillus altitudinis]